MQPTPPKKPTPLWVKILVGLAGIGIIGMFLPKQKQDVARNVEAASQPEMTAEHRDSLNRAKELSSLSRQYATTTSASVLYDYYQSNEVDADNKFKDRVIYVEGIVKNVGKDVLGDIYVALETENTFLSIQCYTDDKEKAGSLKPGDYVALKGKCTGKAVNVTLKNAHLVPTIEEQEARLKVDVKSLKSENQRYNSEGQPQ